MKNNLYLLGAACTVVVLLAACTKNVESVTTEDNNGPVYITASIDSETKATLAETDGAFAFSNGDAIMVCNDSGTFSGTTTSTENSGTFAMADGFNGSTDGIAGFPANMVSAMTTSSVTFTLPTNYDYAAVGGDEPDAAKVPCPMIGNYNAATKKVTLKQAGAVVRFKVTNIKAGSLTFVFSSSVTGAKDTSTPTEEGVGGITTPLTTPGNTITINGVPTVLTGNYVFITIPVPTGTVPDNILVSNDPSDASVSRIQSLTRNVTPDALARAGGYRWGVSPTDLPVQAFSINNSGDKVVLAPGNLMAHIASYDSGVATADEWRFEAYYEYIKGSENGNYLFAYDNPDCVGKWIDSFRWQGASATNKVRGLCNYLYAGNEAYFGNVAYEPLYENCWNTDTDNANPANNGGIYIANGGAYTWRMLTYDEWSYILLKRPTSTLNGIENARCARVKANGVNGLFIFPDNIGSTWNTETMGAYPNDINRTKTYYDEYDVKHSDGTAVTYFSKVVAPETVSTYTADNMTAILAVGVVFLPCNGFISKNAVNSTGEYGYYWTSTSETISTKPEERAWYINFNCDELSPIGGYDRRVGRGVRLARPYTD